jgi:hypothetical protein
MLQHDLADTLAGEERPREIHGQGSLPDSGVHLLGRRRFFRDASGRDQTVDAQGRGQHFSDSSVDAVRVRDVYRHVLTDPRLRTPPV